MPYGSKRSLPPAVKKLPEHAQQIYMKAFNAAYQQYNGSEEKAHAVAWSAVKRKYRKSGEKWVAKDAGMRDSQPFEWEERVAFSDAKTFRVTNAGYLVAEPRVARTGIQEYGGWEMGVDQDVVRVYRSEDEVFDKKSLATFAYKPLTLDHPPVGVDASNWRHYAIGRVESEVARDGEFIRVPLMVCDKQAVDAVRAGKAELSVGYAAEIVWGEGKAPDGAAYDAMQTDIVVNHVAIVDSARGGRLLRIGDEDNRQRRRTMPKVLTFDGISVEMEDERDAQVIEREFKRLNDRVSDLEKTSKEAKDKAVADLAALTTERDALKKQVGDKDVEIAALKKAVEDAKVTPAKLSEMARERGAIIGKAKALRIDGLKVDDNTSDADIRRQVVVAKMPDAKTYSDEHIAIAFATLTKDVKPEDGAGGTASTFDPNRALGNPAATNDYAAAVNAAWDAKAKRVSEAWKPAARQ